MSEINQNTETSTPESSGEAIVRSGSSGEGTVSFDELEALTGGKAKSRHEDTDTPKIKKRGGPDDEPEGKVGGKKKKAEAADEEGDADQDAEADASKTKVAKVDERTDAEKEAAAAASKNVKAYKIKNGDADLDLRADAKIPVKVDGKDTLVTLEELRTEFSGKTDWSRKYTALDTERKAFQSERTELQSGIDQLFDVCVKQSKPLDAIQMLTEMLGGDGVKQIVELRKTMLAQFEEYAKLSPEQREIRAAQEERDLLRSKIDRQQKTEARKSEETKFAARLAEIKTKHKMDDARYEEIQTALKKTGNIPEAELTPELIGHVSDRWIQMDSVDEITAELKLEGEALTSAKNALLAEWGKDKTLTKNQVKAIAQNVFGGKKGKSLMQKKLEKSGGSNTDTSSSKRKVDEPIFFDDLD